MLRGIDPILGPDLLHALRAMGHGDELVIADANFPAASTAARLVRLDGVDAVHVAEAILALMPLDTFAELAAFRMAVVGDAKAVPPITHEFQKVLKRHAPGHKIGAIERFKFYERARGAFVTIATGEQRLYGNLILKKGVLAPGET